VTLVRLAGRRAAIALLVLAIATGCSSVAVPSPPSFGIPQQELDEISRLVGDAVDMLSTDAQAALPSIPADVAETMQQFEIDQVAVPANATEICAALGTPSPEGLAAGGLVTVIRALAGDVSVALAVLVSVVFGTCGSWAPFVDTALEDFFSSQPPT
jgi:hypothetical protein